MKIFSYTDIAFISYKREDEEWAKWLHNKLEYYELPIEILKLNPDLEFAKKPRHVFMDTTDLSGGVLPKAIKDGLDSSKFLIVICSPRSAKSEWVCKEVQAFIDTGREEFIIPFIIEGEPYAKNPENECFPKALKALAGERELLGIFVNENGRDAAAVKVISRLFDLQFDTLWNRFQREQKNRRQIIIIGLVAFILLFAGIALWIGRQYIELKKANETIEHQYLELHAKNVQLKASNDSIRLAYSIIHEKDSSLHWENRRNEYLEFENMREKFENDRLRSKQRAHEGKQRVLSDILYRRLRLFLSDDADERQIRELIEYTLHDW